MYDFLKNSEFYLVVLVKIIERVFDLRVCNFLFDIMFRFRRLWKEKMFY